MFTGIIEELGTIQSVSKGINSAKLCIYAPLVVRDVKIGDSIAVNGICLTVTAFDTASFTAQAMAETLAKTNLGELKAGGKVNLERALRLKDRLGGHLVSGHVDGRGTIISQREYDIAIVYKISYPLEMGKYLAPKGSVAIDGISLTIIDVTPESFTVSLIPHTRGITTLGTKKEGNIVNLEADVIAKYLARLISQETEGKEQASLNLSFLATHGFV